jgi:arylsulfatase A-like enzyme
MHDGYTRESFLRAMGIAAAILFSLSAVQATAATRAVQNQPNIIFIMADDLGYADLGCYGQRVIKTPHIDKLAQEGLRFTQCYAGSTVCAPSRSVLMTGKHTGHTTVRGNFGQGGVQGLGGGQGRVPLEAQDVTVAEVLHQTGYRTGMTGKWGLGEPNTTGEPNSQGFEAWFGYLNQRRAHTYYPSFIWHNRERVLLPGNMDNKKTQYTHDMFTDFALEFVRKNQKKPFFLYLPYCIPHSKYEIPSTDPYANKPWRPDEKVHAAMVTRMDRDVGRLLALLRELNIDQHTIVFFCSDNGAAKRWENRFDSSGPLRGNKRDLYEGGIRTPMIVRWPGRIRAGAESDLAWYFADVLPTLAEIANTKTPAGIDGVSVLPTLLGKKQDLSQRFLYWEFFERGFQQAVRWRNWKAIRLKPGQPLELYDLSKDLGETQNVADQHAQVLARIEAYLQGARTESQYFPSSNKN